MSGKSLNAVNILMGHSEGNLEDKNAARNVYWEARLPRFQRLLSVTGLGVTHVVSGPTICLPSVYVLGKDESKDSLFGKGNFRTGQNSG